MAFLTIPNAICRRFKRFYPLKKLRGVPTILDCVRMGYLDMSQARLKGVGAISSNLESLVVNFINNVLPNITSQGHFNKEFDKLCKAMICIGRTYSVRITYGHAQKVINMALKYLYNEIRLGTNMTAFDTRILNTLCDYFHMPIDSIILSTIHSLTPAPARPICSRIRKSHTGTWVYIKPVTSSLRRDPSWTRMDCQSYWNFVRELKKSLCPNIKPLEVEYITWRHGASSLIGSVFCK